MAGLSFSRKRRKQINYELIREVLVWVFQIALVCLIAFVLVKYFGQRVCMVGDSMNPVLKNGDVSLVNSIAYDAGKPKRGDVIAFKPNGNDSSYYYIKRIIGLPGETVEIRDGKVFIDEKELKEGYKTSEILDVGIIDEPTKLGNNEFFVLGDDRENSEDSRTANVGNVKRSEIAGKVWFVISTGDTFGFVK